MTNQEFFDASVAHLRKQQGVRAVNGLDCRYCTSSGLKCAVGGVMSQQLLFIVMSKGVNGASVVRLLDAVPEAAAFFKGVDENLMSHMQAVHDSEYVVGLENWEREFENVAVKFKLRYVRPT
jgi:hypothetical protein